MLLLLLLIYIYLYPSATMAQGMSVCKTWKELLSDSYFWRRQVRVVTVLMGIPEMLLLLTLSLIQYLAIEPLILKPYNNYTWNQFVYALS